MHFLRGKSVVLAIVLTAFMVFAILSLPSSQPQTEAKHAEAGAPYAPKWLQARIYLK